MIEYLVEIKATEIYQIPVTAKSEADAIDKAYEIFDEEENINNKYWDNSETRSCVL